MRKQVDAQVISKEECRINKEIDRFIKKGYELLGAVSVSVLPSSTHTHNAMQLWLNMKQTQRL